MAISKNDVHEKIAIGVVDDHPLYREGVAATLRSDPRFNVVATGSNGREAADIVRRCAPHVMLLDYNMPHGGAALIAQLSSDFPEVKLVVLTVSEREQDVSESLQAGARGYILKSIAGADLRMVVHGIFTGQSYVMPELAAKLISAIHDRSKSTPAQDSISKLNSREERILDRVASGQTNKEIAIALNLSEKTVKHYMTMIMQKLHVRNRVEAVCLRLQKDVHGR